MKAKVRMGRDARHVWANLYLLSSMLVILSAILCLIFSEKCPWLFSICFLAAAFMQTCHGAVCICGNERHRRDYFMGIVIFLTAAVLISLGIVSVFVN